MGKRRDQLIARASPARRARSLAGRRGAAAAQTAGLSFLSGGGWPGWLAAGLAWWRRGSWVTRTLGVRGSTLWRRWLTRSAISPTAGVVAVRREPSFRTSLELTTSRARSVSVGSFFPLKVLLQLAHVNGAADPTRPRVSQLVV